MYVVYLCFTHSCPSRPIRPSTHFHSISFASSIDLRSFFITHIFNLFWEKVDQTDFGGAARCFFVGTFHSFSTKLHSECWRHGTLSTSSLAIILRARAHTHHIHRHTVNYIQPLCRRQHGFFFLHFKLALRTNLLLFISFHFGFSPPFFVDRSIHCVWLPRMHIVRTSFTSIERRHDATVAYTLYCQRTSCKCGDERLSTVSMFNYFFPTMGSCNRRSIEINWNRRRRSEKSIRGITKCYPAVVLFWFGLDWIGWTHEGHIRTSSAIPF